MLIPYLGETLLTMLVMNSRLRCVLMVLMMLIVSWEELPGYSSQQLKITLALLNLVNSQS